MAVWWSVFLPPFVLSSTAVAGLLLYTFRFFFAIPHPKVCCNKEVPDDAAASPSKAHLGNYPFCLVKNSLAPIVFPSPPRHVAVLPLSTIVDSLVSAFLNTTAGSLSMTGLRAWLCS